MNTSKKNMLYLESSPYLLQHKDNPVHWLAWDESIFDLACREEKAILLSIGYSACHWCHVMAHESFEDLVIAGVMNEHFINVKVDREERPDVDYVYQAALSYLGEQGGWPLTMFLTSEGEPFWGGTYFPPTARFNRPGFLEVLRTIATVYKHEKSQIQSNVATIQKALWKLSQDQSGDMITLESLDRFARYVTRYVDPFYGGLGYAPKFPQCSCFELMWRAWLRTGELPFKQAVVRTLLWMCQGGIYDHLAGGFARYSTDETWLVPHFEKMLYDNAQMISLLTMVWQGTGIRLFEVRVRDTVNWVLTEMLCGVTGDEEGKGGGKGGMDCGYGGFASSLDADSEGEEGRYYVWTDEEVTRVLGTGPEVVDFKEAYDVTERGNWEGKSILNRRHSLEMFDMGDLEGIYEREVGLRGCCEGLLGVRRCRVAPHWDDKVIVEWNGMMIGALARASMVFGVGEWLEVACGVFDFLCVRLGVGGRLLHSWRYPQSRELPAVLDDYAHMCWGGLVLYEATGDVRYIAYVRQWVDTLDMYYWDSERHGYFFSGEDSGSRLVRVRHVQDNVTPSGNGTMIGVLVRLYCLTGEEGYRCRAEEIICAFSGQVQSNSVLFATFLNNVEFFYRVLHVILVGFGGDPVTQELRRIILEYPLPDLLLSCITSDEEVKLLPEVLRVVVEGTSLEVPTVYVCTGGACSLPMRRPEELRSYLERYKPR